MKHLYVTVAAASLLFACGQSSEQSTETENTTATESVPVLALGIDTSSMDTSVRPQDDFFHYVNGTWIKNTEIPADRTRWGSFDGLREDSEVAVRAIIEAAAAEASETGSDAQKVGDLFRSFMDEDRINALGYSPIQPLMDEIASIGSANELAAKLGSFQEIGIGSPFGYFVAQDAKDTTQYIGHLTQTGLGLPDRDYYFNEDERSADIRGKYVDYLEALFALTEVENAREQAERTMAFETQIAESHWDKVKVRDRDKTYNKFKVADLNADMPGFDWAAFFEAAGVPAQEDIIVRQPDYQAAMAALVRDASLEDWKIYLTARLISGAASLLSDDFANANFEFYGKTLRGQPEQRARWKRAVSTVNGSLGETVGRLYVSEHFPPEAKARMKSLVENLRGAFEARVEGLDWMGEATKAEAKAKLESFVAKIGYPDVWKDYSALEIKGDDLAGNMARSNAVEHRRMIAKLGGPIDRTEWLMNPQTVNAYYYPPMNEVVFPAAILRPPFFDLAADDAVNYGAIGAVIGHEFGHGFDDQGSKVDGNGILRNWWTDEDRAAFEEQTKKLVDQYSEFCPVEDACVNGALTQGENIGDLGGLTVAYHAYQRSLGGKPAPVIDGFTGDQRFFLGFGQIWRIKQREEALRAQLKTGPHSPGLYRVNGIVRNMPEFYETFDVKEGDALYLPPEERVSIW